MLGSAVSSSTPRDFHPSSHIGVEDWPVMKRQAPAGLPWGCPYPAVGMHSAFASAIGLPSRSTNALRMLGFLMPAEVRRSCTPASGSSGHDAPRVREIEGLARETRDHSETHRVRTGKIPGWGHDRPVSESGRRKRPVNLSRCLALPVVARCCY